jgi:hypothetical protein
MLFFVTKLSPANPIILGMPWLQRHEPCLCFKELRVHFNSDYCTEHCFLQGIANYNRYALQGCYLKLPKLQPRDPYIQSSNLKPLEPQLYMPPTVENAPDDGKPIQIQISLVKIESDSTSRPQKKVCFTLLLLLLKI